MSGSGQSGGRSVLSGDQRQQYAQTFVQLDTNGDGWLCRQEAAHWIRGVGLNIMDTQIEAIFRIIDCNCDGRITLDEFYKVMELAHQPPTKNSEAAALFRQMDVDGDGFLTVEDLAKGLNHCGYNLTRDQVHKFAANLDKNDDGRIDLNEFLAAFE